MLQRKIHRVVGAEAASRHRQFRRLVLPPDKRQEFMQKVALILQVPQHPHPRVHALVVPTLAIHRVRTKHLQFAALDLGRQRSYHSPIFVLKKSPLRRRKDQQRRPRMPENQRLDVPVQFLTVGFVIFAIHRKSGKRRCRGVARTSLFAAEVSYPMKDENPREAGLSQCQFLSSLTDGVIPNGAVLLAKWRPALSGAEGGFPRDQRIFVSSPST